MSDSEENRLTFDLTGAFLKRQDKLRSDLGLGDIAEHGGTKGDHTELNWMNMLSELLPGRYSVAKAFVVDAQGSRSEQIDVVIYDRHFSPLLFDVGGAKYIPAEGVYAALEVKQTLDKGNMEYAADKIATVRTLNRTSVEVTHAGGTFPPVVPRRIIGGILTRRSDWNPPFGAPFEQCIADLNERDTDGMKWGLDIGCAVEHGGFVVNRDGTGHREGIETSDANVALISFVMRLLKQLEIAGSAPAIDYDSYLRSVPGT
jgi:hypothetical protein